MFFRYSYYGVLKLICVQILLILIACILVSVALKKFLLTFSVDNIINLQLQVYMLPCHIDSEFTIL